MPTAEEHLRADVGGLLMQLIFQAAVLKAENDTLKGRVAALEAARTDDHRAER